MCTYKLQGASAYSRTKFIANMESIFLLFQLECDFETRYESKLGEGLLALGAM